MLNVKKGRLLIAEPCFIDQIFFKSVILITDHSSDESIGLILNEKTKINLNEIINDIPPKDFPVYLGGPVQKNTIHFIHTVGDIIPNSEKIIDGLYWGGEFNKVLELIRKDEISKNQIRFFAGYSGWGEKQLENEIRNNEWIVHKTDINLCMQYSNKKIWSDLIKRKKEKYAIWTNMPKDPSLN